MSSPNYSTTSSYSLNQNYPPQAATAVHYYHHSPPGPYRHYDGGTASSSMRAAGTLAGAMSPELTSPSNVGVHERPAAAATTASTVKNSSESPQLSPVFKSEAAKQIIKEMTEKRVEGPRRRQVPREKRRHYTVSSSKPVLDLEDTFSKMVLFVFTSFFSFSHFFPLFIHLFFASRVYTLSSPLLSRHSLSSRGFAVVTPLRLSSVEATQLRELFRGGLHEGEMCD